MAFERIGLGGVLSVDTTQFTRAMAQPRNALGQFISKANQVPTGLSRIGTAARKAGQAIRTAFQKAGQSLDKFGSTMRTAGMAMAPATLIMYKGVKTAAAFEQGMADLGAVSRASAEDMVRLSDKAKEMGIVTAFSGAESTNAMEQLARAGATIEEQIGGVRGVLDLAAAGNVQYAQSSEIVANITRAMGREFSRTSNLADILALGAARSNVTVQSLGEAFRYGAPQAKTMGIRTEELTAIFGKMGDAGLKGSIAGTSFTNMLVKLSKPTDRAKKLMKKWRIELTEADGSLRPVSSIVAQFSKKLGGMTDAVQRANAMTEIFGVRGQKAYAALATAGKESLDTLTGELKKASDGIGAATEMAQRRLDTLQGAFKMMGASIEGLSIEVFGGLGQGIKVWVQEATTGLNNVLHSLTLLNKAGDDQTKQQQAIQMATEKYGDTATQVALGVRDAIDFMKKAWDAVVGAIKTVGKWLGSTGKQGVRSMVALIGKLVMVAAVAAPVALALGGIAFVIMKVVVPAIVFLGSVLKRVFTTWGAVLLLVAKVYLDVTGKISERSSVLDFQIKKIQARTALRARTSSLRSRQAWEKNMHGASQSAHIAFGDIGSDMETVWKQMEGMTTDLEGDLTHAGAVNVKSLTAQTKNAVKMASTAAQSYKTVVSEAEAAAPAAGDAWRSAAGDVATAYQQLSEEEMKAVQDEGWSIVGVFKAGYDVVTETGKRLYEVSGGVTERIKQERLYVILLRKEYEALAEAGRRAGVTGPSFIQAWVGATQEGVKAGKAELKRLDKWNKEGLQAFEDKFGKAGQERRRQEREAAEKKRTEEEAREKRRKAGLNIKNTVCIDGKEVSWAVAKHQTEVHQRAGGRAQPWQTKLYLEEGAISKG